MYAQYNTTWIWRDVSTLLTTFTFFLFPAGTLTRCLESLENVNKEHTDGGTTTEALKQVTMGTVQKFCSSINKNSIKNYSITTEAPKQVTMWKFCMNIVCSFGRLILIDHNMPIYCFRLNDNFGISWYMYRYQFIFKWW